MASKSIIFAVIVLIYFVLGSGHAGAKVYKDEIAEAVETNIANKVRNILGQVMPGENVLVEVNIELTPSNKKRTLSSIYHSIVPPTVSYVNYSNTQLNKMLKSVTLDIRIPRKLTPTGETELKNLIASAIPWNESRGDKMTFTTLEILRPKVEAKVDSKAEATSNFEILKLQTELKQLKARAEDIRKDRDDVKREAQLSKVELEKTARENLALKSSPTTQNLSFMDRVKRDITSQLGLILLFLAVAMIAFGLISGAKSVGAAVRMIADSLALVGSSLKSISGGEAPNREKANAEPDRTSQSSDTEPRLLSEGVIERITFLRDEIYSMMSSPGAVKELVTIILEYLSKDDTVVKGILVFEMLGKEKGLEIFNRLDIESKARINYFLAQGKFPSNKHQMMFDIGESVKTRILLETFKPRQDKSADMLHQEIALLNKDQVIEVISLIDDIALAKFLSFLKSSYVSAAVNKYFVSDSKVYANICGALLKLPESKNNSDHDSEVMKAIETVKNRDQSSVYKPLLKFYQEIMEAVDDKISEELTDKLSIDETLANHIRTHVITFPHFFRISDDHKREAIEKLSTKSLAALVWGLTDVQKRVVTDLLQASILELVNEEVQTLNQRQSSKTEKLFLDVKSTIVANLRRMNADGVFDNKKIENGTGEPASLNQVA